MSNCWSLPYISSAPTNSICFSLSNDRIASIQASRAVILKKAIDMIVNMEEQLKSIVAENEHLEQVNAELEAELMRLEGGTADVTLNQVHVHLLVGSLGVVIVLCMYLYTYTYICARI